jgi:hypothetical protein
MSINRADQTWPSEEVIEVHDGSTLTEIHDTVSLLIDGESEDEMELRNVGNRRSR